MPQTPHVKKTELINLYPRSYFPFHLFSCWQHSPSCSRSGVLLYIALFPHFHLTLNISSLDYCSKPLTSHST